MKSREPFIGPRVTRLRDEGSPERKLLLGGVPSWLGLGMGSAHRGVVAPDRLAVALGTACFCVYSPGCETHSSTSRRAPRPPAAGTARRPRHDRRDRVGPRRAIGMAHLVMLALVVGRRGAPQHADQLAIRILRVIPSQMPLPLARPSAQRPRRTRDRSSRRRAPLAACAGRPPGGGSGRS